MKPCISGETKAEKAGSNYRDKVNLIIQPSCPANQKFNMFIEPSGIKTKSTNDLQPHADIIAVHTSFNKPLPPLQTILITKVFAGILMHYRSG